MISSDRPFLRVAIVGGGIGGILTAIGLLKYLHIDVQVYEAADEFAEIGAGLLLGPNAVRAMKCISPEIYEAYQQLHTGNLSPKHKHTWYDFVYATGPSAGKTICSVKSEVGQSSIHRGKFLNALVKALPKENTHLGKRLERIEEQSNDQDEGDTVALHFADGTIAEADCVIGADGVHSTTRKFVFPDNWRDFQPVFTGVVGYRGLMPMADARKAMGDELAMNSFTFCGDDCVTASFPIDHGETFNLIATKYSSSRTWDGPWVQSTNFEEIKDVFSDWPAETFKLLKALDRPNIMKWSIWKTPDIPQSHRGRICIIGDAAHAALPTHAAGAGQAIEDAWVMSAVLGNVKHAKDILAAFRGYDKIRLPRAQLNGQLSDEALEIFNLRRPGVLDDPTALKKAIQYRMDWLWNRDIALEAVQACLIADNIVAEEEREHICI